MSQNAREIYKNLQNVYGDAPYKALENHYSADGQCEQYAENKVNLVTENKSKKWSQDIVGYANESYLRN